MALVAIGLPVGVLLASEDPARAATPFELVSADSTGAAVAGTTAAVSPSSDGRIVAFSQAGADCPSSAVYVRDRQAKATTLIGPGQLGAITADGAKVAYVSCTGPEIAVFAGGASTPVTNGQWRAQGATKVVSLAVSTGGRYAAFTTDNNQVWVADLQTKTVVVVPGVTGTVARWRWESFEEAHWPGRGTCWSMRIGFPSGSSKRRLAGPVDDSSAWVSRGRP